ncbi:hypothetical protein RO3G_02166 [Rhizopus delemar RA 99-880]|uniref:Uncharacterized protein n=1 Tax=Rhizopus delemar (strain RA 99-880 / ATCC MYA-4621 / FGSC 9543 / NRRL 43880) TaxID=246409 RepID=I1BMN2_RHIO9|nr:hypothetical protein RO3G_02166 [Rhizopus delemar RA 99-880]|eukprot:EIE77462.1 hypothetical protein RO3G_02166 [Rhizopus delemar RA 99-880]
MCGEYLETRLRLTQKMVVYLLIPFIKKASKKSDEDIFKCLDNATSTVKGKKKLKCGELKHGL